jgi:predicted RecA/RadA family phage recombinase
MAQNKVQKGDKLTLIAPSGGVVSEMGYIINGLFVVAETSAAEGEEFVGNTTDVWTLPKATGVAFAQGAATYWDVADQELNTDATNPCVGHASVAAGEAATTVDTRLVGTPIATSSATQTRLGDLEQQRTLGTATSKTMTTNDTYVPFTEDAQTVDGVDVNDEIEWEATIAITAMNAPAQITVQMQVGSLAADEVVLATGDANDWVKLKGKVRYTATTTGNVIAGEGCGSDGGSVTRDTPTQLLNQTLPTQASPVVLTPRIKSATGNAGNTAVLTSFRTRLVKGYATS